MTPASNSDVLVVVPTLGRRLEMLRRALQSIATQKRPADIVVVAPVHAEDARALAADVRATVLDDPGGLSAAINLGMAAARPSHRFGNWLGDDDELVPGSLSATANCLDSDGNVAVAFGHCVYVDNSGQPIWRSRAGRWAPALLPWGPNLVPQPGMLFRLDDFRAVGGLDEQLEFAMDLDLLLKLRRRGSLCNVGVEVSWFRWHPDSLTVGDRETSLVEAAMVKRRHLPPYLRPLSGLWESPVRLATHVAARRLSALADGHGGQHTDAAEQ